MGDCWLRSPLHHGPVPSSLWENPLQPKALVSISRKSKDLKRSKERQSGLAFCGFIFRLGISVRLHRLGLNRVHVP